MSLLRTVIHAYLYLPYWFYKITRTGAFGHKKASYVPTPPLSDGTRVKKALFKHYTRQYHEASCSVASVVTVVNALRSLENDQMRPVSQMEMLEKITIGHWKERMSENGHNGKRGLPLSLLGKIVTAGLNAYHVKHNNVVTIQTPRHANQALRIKAALRRHLNGFETRDNCVIIAHFNQGLYVPTLGIPHISPVGGFDHRTDRVTLLDVDPEQPGPYQIDFNTFYKGLTASYNPVFRHFGYKNGGYVLVEL